MAECVYCKSEVPSNVYKVCELPASTLYLFREQTHYGRCVVVERGHHKELFELSDEELAAYMRDVSAVAKAMDQLFSPDKINYGYFSDKMGHIHFHLVPKRQSEPEWGGTFVVDLGQTYLTEQEYAQMAARLVDALTQAKKI